MRRSNPRRRRLTGREHGFTIIDTVMALTILTVAVLALAATLMNTSQLAEETRLMQVLSRSVRNVIDALRAESFDTLTTRYGRGTSQGRFWCDEHGAVTFTAPARASVSGSIEFFDDESTIPTTFANTYGDLDINADGNVSGGSAANYRVLPTRVTLTTASARGRLRTVTVDIFLTETRSW